MKISDEQLENVSGGGLNSDKQREMIWDINLLPIDDKIKDHLIQTLNRNDEREFKRLFYDVYKKYIPDQLYEKYKRDL